MLELSHLICQNFKITSPDYIQNTWSRSFLGVKFVFVNQFSKLLWHFLRLLACKWMIRSHLAGSISEQDDILQKAVSKR